MKKSKNTNIDKKLCIEEEKEEKEEIIDYNQFPPKDIFSYNELKSCADIFRLWKEGTLEVPNFQRNLVWSSSFQTRFIDSLIKELPIPSMCFSYDKSENKMKIIDGLQRISSVTSFLDTDKEWKLSKLDDVDPLISGRTNIDIYKENIDIFRSVQNKSIAINFLRINHSNKEHNEFLFQVFHRLNAFGQKLTNQEIRNCIYSGVFNELLKTLNNENNWKKLLNFKEDLHFKKVELILRCFAFLDNSNSYEGHLNKFLNSYMSLNRSNENLDKANLFREVIELILNKATNNESFDRNNNVIMETLFFGIAKNIKKIRKDNKISVTKNYNKLIKSRLLNETNLSAGTLKRKKVEERLKLAKDIFSK